MDNLEEMIPSLKAPEPPSLVVSQLESGVMDQIYRQRTHHRSPIIRNTAISAAIILILLTTWFIDRNQNRPQSNTGYPQGYSVSTVILGDHQAVCLVRDGGG